VKIAGAPARRRWAPGIVPREIAEETGIVFQPLRNVLQDELRSERNSGACSQIQVVQGHDGEGHIRMLLSFLMPTDHIVALLIAERDKLNAAIEALQGTSKDAPPKKPAAIETSVTAPTSPKKRHVSAAARKRMAEGQKKRWAAIKAAK